MLLLLFLKQSFVISSVLSISSDTLFKEKKSSELSMLVHTYNQEEHVFTPAWATWDSVYKNKTNMQDEFLGQYSYKRGES